MSFIQKLLCVCVTWMLLVSPFFSAAPVMATSANTLDPFFQPVLAARGTVKGILPLAEGKVLVYGKFASINGLPRTNIAILNADGSVDTSFNLSAELRDPYIDAAALAGGGKILIGGYLIWYGPDRIQQYLFRLNPDGSLDTTFNPAGFDLVDNHLYGLDGPVTALRVDGSGRILVGGDFTAPSNHITRLNSDGSLDTTFQPGTGADGKVTLIDLQSTGHIVLGGAFTMFNGAASNGLARLGPDGAFDGSFFGTGISGFSPGGLDGVVSSLLVAPDDNVYIGGTFANVKGQYAGILARIKANGELDTAYTPFVRGYLEEVTSLLLMNSTLVVGGWSPIMYFNGHPTDHDARIYMMQSTDGSFINFAMFKGRSTDVYALAKRSDGKVLAGGTFTQTDGDPTQYYAGLYLFDPVTTVADANFRPIVGGQANLSGLLVQPNGQVIASGSFYRANGELYDGLVRLTSGGGTDTAFVPSTGQIRSVALRPDGKLAVSGVLDADGYTDLALLNSDGSTAAEGTAGGGTSLLAQPDNGLIVTTFHQPGVARFLADLSADTSFAQKMGSGISNAFQPDGELDRVNIAVLHGSRILAGGSFSTFSGTARQNLVRLNADGSIDAGFASPTFTVATFRTEVFALAVQPDGKVLVGGRFSTVNGSSSPSLVRLNVDGSVDPSFHSPFDDNGLTVYALAVQADGKVLVGGNIQLIDGSNIYDSLVRLNTDGSRDTEFQADVHGTVYRLAFSSPNAVLLAGEFDKVDGVARYGLARYQLSVTLPTITSNFSHGAPGSFFTLTAAGFTPGAALIVSVNGHQLAGEVMADENGGCVFVLDGALASPGYYLIEVALKPFDLQLAAVGAQTAIEIDPSAPVREKTLETTTFHIPEGMAQFRAALPMIVGK